jgi:hypothetical protein
MACVRGPRQTRRGQATKTAGARPCVCPFVGVHLIGRSPKIYDPVVQTNVLIHSRKFGVGLQLYICSARILQLERQLCCGSAHAEELGNLSIHKLTSSKQQQSKVLNVWEGLSRGWRVCMGREDIHTSKHQLRLVVSPAQNGITMYGACANMWKSMPT